MTLEILVATMNRNNLDFLIPMFPFAHFSQFSILVINQTDEINLLKSEFPNVRILNSFDIGLSKSRNMALQNAIGEIAVIADDDVVFLPDFQEVIVKTHKKNNDFSVICFQTLTTKNKLYSNYSKREFIMKDKHFLNVLSIELTFKVADLKQKNVIFNKYFGLGAQFQDAESLFFLRRANHNQAKILFSPQNIVIHEEYSSSDEIASDRILYAKTAGFYKVYKSSAYILLLKLLFFLLRKKLILKSQIIPKFKSGLKGIQDYKILLKTRKEDFYN